MPLLMTLTKFKPRGGIAGEVHSALPRPSDEWFKNAGKLNEHGIAELSKSLTTNTFRPTLSAAIGIEDLWPWLLVVCGTAFFADVFVRRVSASPLAIVGSFLFVICLPLLIIAGYVLFQRYGLQREMPQINWWTTAVVISLLTVYVAFYLSFFVTSDWFKAKYETAKASLFRREVALAQSSMSRLQSRKAEIERDIESRRAATKFAPAADEKISGKRKLEEVLASEIEKTPALPPKIQRDKLNIDEENSYTSRLLDAKRKVQQERDRNKKPDDQS